MSNPIDELLKLLQGAGADVHVIRGDEDPDKYNPEKVIEKFTAHYQTQIDRETVTIEQIDEAADILLGAADLSFRGETRAGRTATDAFTSDYTVEQVAMDGVMSALIRMGFDTEAEGGRFSHLPDDERGHVYLEGSQILRDVIGNLKLPEGTVN